MENRKDKDVRNMYLKAPYPFISEKEFNNFKLSFIETLEGLVDIADLQDKAILDAGCGTGEKSCILAGIANKVVCVDASSESLKYAIENSKKLGLENMTFVEDSLLSLTKISEAEKFDIVFCSGVLHHLSDPYLGFKNILKHLKPGGLVIISLYHPLGLFFYHCKYTLISVLAGNNEEKRLRLALMLYYRGADMSNPTVRSKIYDTYIHPQISFFSMLSVYSKLFIPNQVSIKNIYAKYTGIRFILNYTSNRRIKTKLRLIDIGYFFIQKGFVYVSGIKN